MAVDLPTPFSFTNIFKLHAVVAFVFLLPVLNGGLKGFIETITEGESGAPTFRRLARESRGARLVRELSPRPARALGVESAKSRATRPGGEATRRATVRVSSHANAP